MHISIFIVSAERKGHSDKMFARYAPCSMHYTEMPLSLCTVSIT